MADFTWIPDYDMEEATMPRILQAQFGDGYRQRAADGLNNMLRNWSVAFNNRSKAEAQAIIDFFKARQGVTEFTYQLADSTEVVTVTCKSWSRRWAGFDTYNVTCKFDEEVSIGV